MIFENIYFEKHMNFKNCGKLLFYILLDKKFLIFRNIEYIRMCVCNSILKQY